MEDRLDLMDQGSFLGLRALGHQPHFQGTWLYDRPVDLVALRAFNENLARTLLGRLVDRSPLPFGRHRWVRVTEAPQIVVESVPRDRAGVDAWAESIADRTIDPEHGPGWLIAVLPLIDGGSAVTMPVPHTLGDGLCVLQAIGDAVAGRARGPEYPVRGTTSRWRRLLADLGASIRGLPAVARAIVAGLRVLRSEQDAAREPAPARRALPAATDEPFRVPLASVLIEQSEWDEVAARLGGTSNTLVSAFAARVGERLGRTGADGVVRLAVPVSVRVEDDTRANALDSITLPVEPQGLLTDLRPLRAATKAALTGLAASAHALTAALPLTPYLPRALVRRTEALALGAADLPVGCSNYGDLDPLVGRIDDADATAMYARLVEPGITAADLARIGGQAYVLSGRILDRVFLSTIAHGTDHEITAGRLREVVLDVLAEFGLTPAP